MSQKRKHGDAADGGGDAPHFKKQRSFKPRGGERGKPQPGQARGRQAHGDDQAQADSTSSLKSRIRNLTRLLGHLDKDKKNKVPANVRNERERELEACKHELEEKLAEDRESNFRNKIIGKYHHIRFFERQKATRNVKRLTKQMSTVEDNSERAALRSKIHNADVDVNYTIYYPLLRPYVSLYPKKESSEPAESSADAPSGQKKASESADGPKGDVDVWKAIEEAMEAGTLDRLRNSKEGVVMPQPKVHAQKKVKSNNVPKSSKGEQRIAQENNVEPMEEDEDGDGFGHDFFDE